MSSIPLLDSDTSGRRWPLEEKRRIVELTMKKGSSVRAVAQKFCIGLATLYHWKALYRKGYLGISEKPRKLGDSDTRFLPVTIQDPSLSSGQISVRIESPSGIAVHIEIEAHNFQYLNASLAQILR